MGNRDLLFKFNKFKVFNIKKCISKMPTKKLNTLKLQTNHKILNKILN